MRRLLLSSFLTSAISTTIRRWWTSHPGLQGSQLYWKGVGGHGGIQHRRRAWLPIFFPPGMNLLIIVCGISQCSDPTAGLAAVVGFSLSNNIGVIALNDADHQTTMAQLRFSGVLYASRSVHSWHLLWHCRGTYASVISPYFSTNFTRTASSSTLPPANLYPYNWTFKAPSPFSAYTVTYVSPAHGPVALHASDSDTAPGTVYVVAFAIIDRVAPPKLGIPRHVYKRLDFARPLLTPARPISDGQEAPVRCHVREIVPRGFGQDATLFGWSFTNN